MARGRDAEWQFFQSFASDSISPDEIIGESITAVEFDHTGQYIATGDKAGRIKIYESDRAPALGRFRMIPPIARPAADAPVGEAGAGGVAPYRLLIEYQSHCAEFDYLKSLEIEEKINKIRWCRRSNSAMHMLTTNDKTVKLWKVQNKQITSVASMNVPEGMRRGGPRPPVTALGIPRLLLADQTVAALARRQYMNAHAYHINSIALNSDGEHFISADDLRVNFWNLERSEAAFNIIDIKPENMEDLTEVITAADFHPTHCNQFIYSSSGGNTRLVDMRMSALCEEHFKIFEEEEDPAARSFFSEIISSVSDAKFSVDGRYIFTRDYLTLKVWDINMEARPVNTIQIRESLRGRLSDLYENDCIFDKFEVALSGDGTRCITGSYGNYFHVCDRYGEVNQTTQAGHGGGVGVRRGGARVGPERRRSNPAIGLDEGLDYTAKALHVSWHPREPMVAIASLNNLFIYGTGRP